MVCKSTRDHEVAGQTVRVVILTSQPLDGLAGWLGMLAEVLDLEEHVP